MTLRSTAARADKNKFLLHGIGVGAQRSGSEPAQMLAEYERWAGLAPLVAFHA